jgi:2'-5' RNA ligase
MSDSPDWRQAYQYGCFVIWPPNDVRGPINELRSKYDPRSQSYCEAHISLTPPLLSSLNGADIAALDSIVGATDPFTVRYGPPEVFPGSNCIYLQVEPQDTITRLRSGLIGTGLFHPSAYPNFITHCTVSEFGTNDQATTLELLNLLRDTSPSGTFHCTSIALIVPDENFHFSISREFSLGEASNGA